LLEFATASFEKSRVSGVFPGDSGFYLQQLVFGESGIYTLQPLLLQAAISEVAKVLPCYSLLSQSHFSSPQPLFVRLFDFARSSELGGREKPL
jgi:hypothetical protein